MPQRAMRRASAIAIAILGLSIAIASAAGTASARKTPAQATQGETYSLSFSPNQPKVSTSVTFKVNTPKLQPTSVTMTLPTGSSLNTSAAPKCAQPPTCEPSTQVGTGVASVTYKTYVIPLDFSVYNTQAGLALVITLPNGPPVVVLPTWSGSTLTIPLPNGYYKGVPIVITELALTFNSIGHGGGAWIRTPGTCPKGGWTSQGTIVYTGVTDQLNASAKCSAKPPKKKKKKKS